MAGTMFPSENTKETIGYGHWIGYKHLDFKVEVLIEYKMLKLSMYGLHLKPHDYMSHQESAGGEGVNKQGRCEGSAKEEDKAI